MEASVDTCIIIGIRRFQIIKDRVLSLSIKSYDAMFEFFVEVVDYISLYEELPATTEICQQLPYRRDELGKLCLLDLEITSDEIDRRIHATDYPRMPGAYFIIYDRKFEHNSKR